MGLKNRGVGDGKSDLVTRENKGRVVGEVVFEIGLQGFAESCDCNFKMELRPPCFGA